MISGNRILARRLLAALAVALILVGVPAAAADGTADNTLDEVMSRLRNVKTASGKFVEKKYLRILSEPLESSGTLVYTAPDRLEKNTLWPNTQNLIIVGDELTIAGDAGQQRVLKLAEHPEIEAFIESVRATLAGNIDALRRYYDIGLKGDAEQWTLSLRPTGKAMREMIKTVTLSGREGLLQLVEIDEADGDRSVMTVTPN
jgi:outer membrane lipoprotein-sorting protein